MQSNPIEIEMSVSEFNSIIGYPVIPVTTSSAFAKLFWPGAEAKAAWKRGRESARLLQLGDIGELKASCLEDLEPAMRNGAYASIVQNDPILDKDSSHYTTLRIGFISRTGCHYDKPMITVFVDHSASDPQKISVGICSNNVREYGHYLPFGLTSPTSADSFRAALRVIGDALSQIKDGNPEFTLSSLRQALIDQAGLADAGGYANVSSAPKLAKA